jgi:formate dehydrogenase subunit beta
MGSSCVACGMCSDVCPVDIPVSEIFKAGGESIQGVFNYQPGQNLDAPLPLVTYQEKELHEMED